MKMKRKQYLSDLVFEISALKIIKFESNNISRLMKKPTNCICQNKDADQLCGNWEADQCFVFATRIVQFLFYLNLKFQASSSFL